MPVFGFFWILYVIRWYVSIIGILYSVPIESRRTQSIKQLSLVRKTFSTVISKAQRWCLSVGAPEACVVLISFQDLSCFFEISSHFIIDLLLLMKEVWILSLKSTVTLYISKTVDKSPSGAQPAIPRIRFNNMLKALDFLGWLSWRIYQVPFF